MKFTKLSPEELEVSESDETTLDERAASTFKMNSNTKYFQFEGNNGSEALNDVKNKVADQVRVCTEKIKMASDFAKMANFDSGFLL